MSGPGVKGVATETMATRPPASTSHERFAIHEAVEIRFLHLVVEALARMSCDDQLLIAEHC